MKKQLVLLCVVLYLLFAASSLIVVAQEQDAASSTATPTVENPLRSEVSGSKTDDSNTNTESVAKLREAIGKGQKFQFQAEINQLLSIIINSLYTNKEICVRELISNASDALDKIRYVSLTNRTVLDTNGNLEIRIQTNPQLHTLTISDSGVGMTKKDLAENLGTIARSGTKAFIEKLKEAKDNSFSLIGQFGVGFYSAFLIADSVIVSSKHNDEEKQYIWESRADNTFTIAEDPRGNTLGRGTEITLHLKDDAKDYLNPEFLKDIIHKYSEFIQYPIYLYTTKNETREVPVVEESKPEETKAEEKKDDEVKVEEEKKDEKPKTKTITETKNVWEVMNENKPIWTRDPKSIAKEEYNSFYKAISKDAEEPLTYTHFKSEGSNVDFRALLYVPKQPPQNMFDFMQKQNNIRLYVKRVFITDAINDLIPRYLNFIRGVVDSDDLPLNISRELLQNSHLLKLIKKKLVHKIISMFKALADRAEKKNKEAESKDSTKTEEEKKADADEISKFNQFWKDYGKNVKLGVIEDNENRNRLLKLIRFYSTKSEFFYTGLDEYVSRMKPKQKHIYFLSGESIEELKKSPFLEEFRSRDLEVLYMTDPIDEYMTQQVKDYDGKELMSITREGLKLDEETDEQKKKEEELKKEFEPLTGLFKDILGQKIIKAEIGSRFTSSLQSPIVVAATKYGYTANMVRIMKAQTLGTNEQQYLNMFANAKIIELNPYHSVIRELNKRAKQDKTDSLLKSVAELLWETAQLRSGYGVDDSQTFADRIFDLMRSGLHIDAEVSGTTTQEAPKEKSAKDEL